MSFLKVYSKDWRLFSCVLFLLLSRCYLVSSIRDFAFASYAFSDDNQAKNEGEHGIRQAQKIQWHIFFRSC